MDELRLDWNEIVELRPKGYAEFQDHRRGLVYHGPVEKVEITDDDVVQIHLKYVAQMGLPGRDGFGNWVKAPDEKKLWEFPNLIIPFVFQDLEKGKRILFANTQLLYIDDVESKVKFNENGEVVK